jgi:hypothetical protein
MELFFHHVGQAGADEDFPKTVFADVDLTRIEQAIPLDDPLRDDILDTLGRRFPEGSCNCWGVPMGARWPIAHLAHGDAVLLVEADTADGRVPALCPDVLYWNRPYHDVSAELWGNPRYPYVFFFRTEPLDLTWHEMRADLRYAPDWVPRNFFRITPPRLAPFGGPEGYLQRLRQRHGQQPDPFAPLSLQDQHAQNQHDEPLVIDEVNRELAVLAGRLAQPPTLTEGLEPELHQVLARPRSAAFQVAVRRAYGERCAICGSGLRSPHGAPEVQSAHIYPKAHDGRDDVRNGVCLCRRHHWALDVGWIALADDGTLLVRDDLPDEPDYAFLRACAGQPIASPVLPVVAPAALFLRAHRQLMGFDA